MINLVPKVKDAPKTSAKSKKEGRKNCRLAGSIVAQVQHEIAVQKGEVIEIEEEDTDDEEDDNFRNVSCSDTIKLCDQLEKISLKYGNSSTSLELNKQLCQFRVFLRCEDLLKSTQSTLNGFVVRELSSSNVL